MSWKNAAALGLLLFSLAGCGGAEESVTLTFRGVEDQPGPGLSQVIFDAFGRVDTLFARDEILMSGRDIAAASVVAMGNRPGVEVLFTEEGRTRWAEVTEAQVGKRIGIFLDGTLVSAPVVRAPIREGKAIINGDFTEEEAQRIAVALSPRTSSRP